MITVTDSSSQWQNASFLTSIVLLVICASSASKVMSRRNKIHETTSKTKRIIRYDFEEDLHLREEVK